MFDEHSALEGFVPPLGYKPRAEAYINKWGLVEITFGPILRLASQRYKQLQEK
jgi:hypothetical protein